MIVIILEDQYAEKIALDLQKQDKSFKIPIKWNIKNPEEYL
jgi:hypothetical protein